MIQRKRKRGVVGKVIKPQRMQSYQWNRMLHEAKRTVDQRSLELQHILTSEKNIKDARKSYIRDHYKKLKKEIQLKCNEAITKLTSTHKTSYNSISACQKQLKSEQRVLEHLRSLKVYSHKHEEKLALILNTQQKGSLAVKLVNPDITLPSLSALKSSITLSSTKVLTFREVMRPLYDEIHPVFNIDIVGILDSFHGPPKPLDVTRATKIRTKDQTVLATISATVVATGHKDGTIRMWNTQSGELINSFKPHGRSIRAIIAVDEKSVASADICLGVVTVVITDTRSAKEIQRFSLPEYIRYWYHPVQLALLDESRYLVVSSEQKVYLWSLLTNRYVTSLKLSSNTRVRLFTYNKRRVIIAMKSTCQIWSPLDDQTHLKIICAGLWVEYYPIPLDDQKVITSSCKGVGLWDIKSGRCIRMFTKRCGIVRLFPDGERVLVVINNTVCEIYDICTGICLQRWRIDTNYSNSVCIPSNEVVVFGGTNTVTIWG